jgi:hypothetical protein
MYTAQGRPVWPLLSSNGSSLCDGVITELAAAWHHILCAQHTPHEQSSHRSTARGIRWLQRPGAPADDQTARYVLSRSCWAPVSPQSCLGCNICHLCDKGAVLHLGGPLP